MSTYKTFDWGLRIYNNKFLLFISLLLFLFFDYILFETSLFIRDIISILILVPLFVLFIYFGLFVLSLHSKNATKAIALAFFTVLISIFISHSEVDNILLSVFQDLLVIPIFFGILYVPIAIVIEVFRKFNRSELKNRR